METNPISARIGELLPGIRARRQEIEQLRCLPHDLVEEIRRTGITHHFTVASHTWEEVGRVLLGRDPAVAVF